MLTHEQIEEVYLLLKDVGDYQIKEQLNLKTIESTEKALNQLVSYVDIQSEKMLVTGLQALVPEAGFITEESTIEQEQKTLTWIIDPLDGTTNYLFGHQQYAISIALQENQKTVFACVYIPKESKAYMANQHGAYLNGDKLEMQSRPELKDSLIATGFPYYNFKEIDEYLEILKALMKGTKGLRRMGSAAIDLAYTAESKFDGFFELNLSPWDVAGGAFIIEQAGGKVIDFRGGVNYIFGNSIIAGNHSIVAHLQQLIAENMTDMSYL